MEIKDFYDQGTNTLTYVVYDVDSRDAVVIDPVLDYDAAASTTSTDSVDKVIGFLKTHALTLRLLLETHAHADHLSGAQELKRIFPDARTAIGEGITQVQSTFKEVFGLPEDFPADGRQFDRLLSDGETVRAGSLTFEVIHTPGHTPADAAYLFGEAVFTGDSMFMPDGGTGRCDFPAGSATELYRSITERLYVLPDETRVFVGHDYQPGGRELRFQSSIGEQKRDNVQLPLGRGEADFVKFRSERDKTLSAPKLLFQSVQVNIDGGNLPGPAANEVRYLKIPINVFRPKPESREPTKQPITLEAI